MIKLKNSFMFLRYISTSRNLNGESKVMKKILTGSNKKKFRYSETPILTSPNMFSKGVNEGNRSVNSRRATVLNKLFMRNITDLMLSGDCSAAFLDYNIEINRVCVVPDFKCINVFWVAKGNDNDEVIEKLLEANASALRHELSQLKVIGVVPKIKFLKDKQQAQIMKLDLQLSKADFGDDYIPTDTAIKLKTQLALDTKLPPEIKKKIENLDNELEQIEKECKPIPSMPNNVLGLNHGEIMERIKKSMKRTKTIKSNSTGSRTANNNCDPVEFIDLQTQRAALKDFLLKRQLLKSKARREQKNYLPEMDYLEELEKNRQRSNASEFPSFYDDDDYIEEEEEQK